MEQVKINVPDGYELKQEGNTYTVIKKENKLEIGKDYVFKQNGKSIIINRKGDYGNTGFLKSVFSNCMACLSSELWSEATEEEVIEAFEKECVHRFGEDWKEVRLENDANGEMIALNSGRLYVEIRKCRHGGWEVWNKNGCLYREGKWAEKLEEPKFAETLEEVDRPWYLNSYGDVSKSPYSNFCGHHVPTIGLAEGILALTQLLSFRHDVWDKEGKPEDDYAWCIANTIKGELEVIQTEYGAFPFSFKKKETAKWFMEKHKQLLEEYLNKIVL